MKFLSNLLLLLLLAISATASWADESCKDDRDWSYEAETGGKRSCAAISRGLGTAVRCFNRVSPEGVVAKDACISTCRNCDGMMTEEELQEILLQEEKGESDANSVAASEFGESAASRCLSLSFLVVAVAAATAML